MNMKISVSAEIWLALGMDKWPTNRKLAAHAAFDLWMWEHELGYFGPIHSQMSAIEKRWHLGDWLQALSAHYPIRVK